MKNMTLLLIVVFVLPMYAKSQLYVRKKAFIDFGFQCSNPRNAEYGLFAEKSFQNNFSFLSGITLNNSKPDTRYYSEKGTYIDFGMNYFSNKLYGIKIGIINGSCLGVYIKCKTGILYRLNFKNSLSYINRNEFEINSGVQLIFSTIGYSRKMISKSIVISILPYLMKNGLTRNVFDEKGYKIMIAFRKNKLQKWADL
jgi:hypothetical protein